jgi:glycine/D-amino acid oxidase-like deaminating enzyme
VTEPIGNLHRQFPNGLLFWDLDDPYIYGRTTDDGRLLVGGKDETYRDPLRRRRAMPSKIRALAATVPRRFPRVGEIEVAFSWSGTFAETPDGLAYIGGHSRYPRCQFALGFGGNGITYSALAAEYIADSLTDDGPGDEARLFRLDRPTIRPS